jgi:outer membrane lipoprotein-sorting protein
MTDELVFSDFTTREGVTIPRTIRAVNHKRRQIVTLSYDDVRPNAPDIRFEFSPPRNAQRVEWK